MSLKIEAITDRKKLVLSEDDDLEIEEIKPSEEPDIEITDNIVDDEIEVEEKPAEDFTDNFISLVTGSIRNVWEHIDDYSSIKATIEYENGPKELVDMYNEIINDEMIHVGQLEKALSLLQPNAELIKDGEDKADELLTNLLKDDEEDEDKDSIGIEKENAEDERE